MATLLDYVATYPNDGIRFRASSMVLAAHSNASFLTEPGSRSRTGAHIFLSEDDGIPRPNGPVLTISSIIRFVMASAAEAVLAALYTTAREMIPLRNALTEMAAPMTKGVPQANGTMAVEPVMDVKHIATSVLHMANLPLDTNVQFMTVMATAMPFIGRG